MLNGVRELLPLRELERYPAVKHFFVGSVVACSFAVIYLSMLKTSRVALETFDLIQPRNGIPDRFTLTDLTVIGTGISLALFAIWQALNFPFRR